MSDRNETEDAIQMYDRLSQAGQAGQADGMSMALVTDPQKVLDQATKACEVLSKVIKERRLFVQIGREKHIKIEAWLLLASFFGVTPRLQRVVPVVDDLTGATGFEATVEAIDRSGAVRGRASARCLSNEENWGMRNIYEKGTRKKIGERMTPAQQIESMAQTRAASKVLSQLFRYVIVLGGFSGTPAEEMDGQTVAANGTQGEQSEERQNGARISEGQRKRIFAVARDRGVPFEKLPELFKRYGFAMANEVTTNVYDRLVADIGKPPVEG